MHEARCEGRALLSVRADVASLQGLGADSGARAATARLHRPAGHQEHAQREDDVNDGVKAGQAWVSKNTGARLTVVEDGLEWVGVVDIRGLKSAIKKSHIIEDFILVKDAP